jgi:16S rRNA (guanine527-N7)-methyltransferase
VSLNDKTKVFEELYYVSRETIEKLLIYEKLIIDAQEKYNLVGKSTLNQVWLRHFADSAKIFQIIEDKYYKSNKDSISFADIGSGAGFPGVVISLMLEAKNMIVRTVLIDSNKKKSSFLENVKKKMGLSYNVLNKRSESVEEKFDIITARAVTSIKKFLDINYNLFKNDSIIILLKGKTWREEIKESKKKWKFQFNVVKNNNQLDASGGVTLIIRNIKK